MTGDDALRTALLDLHHELDDHEVKLFLGGGYDLFLKQSHPARSTSDLDIFLKASGKLEAEGASALQGRNERTVVCRGACRDYWRPHLLKSGVNVSNF